MPQFDRYFTINFVCKARSSPHRTSIARLIFHHQHFDPDVAGYKKTEDGHCVCVVQGCTYIAPDEIPIRPKKAESRG